MSGRSDRSDYIVLIVLAVVTVVVIAWLSAAEKMDRDPDEFAPLRTTHSTGKTGLMGLYELLDELDFDVSRWYRLLEDGRLADVGVTVVLDPLIDVSAEEVRCLEQQIRSGGVLICTESWWRSIRGPHRPYHSFRSPYQWSDREQIRMTTVPAASSEMPLARDVSSVTFATASTIDTDIDSSRQATALFSDDYGVRIVSLREGEGEVILLSDSSFLANGRLDKGDNPVLAVNLIAYARSRSGRDKIVFDEYHFGHGPQETGWTIMRRMLLTTNAGWAVLALVIAGLLWLVLKGRRFGTRRGDHSPRRRSKLEYAYSVGATYRSTGASALTFCLLFRWFRARLARRAGVPAHASSKAIATHLALGDKAQQQRLKEFIDDGDRITITERMSRGKFNTMVKKTAELESEILHGDFTGE